MECEIAREVASAELDGERPPVVPPGIAAHLAGCNSCRAWLADAQELTRRIRLAAVEPSADRTDALLAVVLADRTARDARRMARVRIGLIVVAAAQALFGLSPMLFGHHVRSPHPTHELDIFALALVVGFLAAARRPGYAAGMVALVGVVAVGLFATAVIDLTDGHTGVANEVSHLPAVLGWLLLCRLAHLCRDGPNGPAAWRALLSMRWRRSNGGTTGRSAAMADTPAQATARTDPSATRTSAA